MFMLISGVCIYPINGKILKICHLNIQSVKKNEFQLFVQIYKFVQTTSRTIQVMPLSLRFWLVLSNQMARTNLF